MQRPARTPPSWCACASHFAAAGQLLQQQGSSKAMFSDVIWVRLLPACLGQLPALGLVLRMPPIGSHAGGMVTPRTCSCASSQAELDALLKDYVGRPSPLYHADRLSEHYRRCTGAQHGGAPPCPCHLLLLVVHTAWAGAHAGNCCSSRAWAAAAVGSATPRHASHASLQPPAPCPALRLAGRAATEGGSHPCTTLLSAACLC